MPYLKAGTTWFVLTATSLIVLFGQTTSAAPNLAFDLKKGELESLSRSAIYNARVAFVLYSSATKEREQILNQLASDSSPQALQALAEIASVTKDIQVREFCTKTLLALQPRSVPALTYLKTYGSTKALKEQVGKNLALTEPAGTAGDSNTSNANTSISLASDQEISILKSIFNADPKAGLDQVLQQVLGQVSEVNEDPTNGSRYLVQSYFLKRILALQNASAETRQAQFSHLLNEVESFLHRRAKKISIAKPQDFTDFKNSLMSRYAMLNDEMRFSRGLSDRSPVVLNVRPAMDLELKEFSTAFRQADKALTFPQKGYFFDLLSDRTQAGVLFRLQLKSLPSSKKEVLLNEISSEFKKKHESLQNVAQQLMESGAIKFSNPAEQRFFELMILNYFSTYTFDETANVMKAMIERPDLAHGNELFRFFVMYAGPQMQKLLQVVGRRPGLSPELSETFQALEDAGLNSPWEKISPNFKEAPEGYEWVSITRTPFVGSMAETYKGVVRDLKTGELVTIAARTLKSEIRNRIENEIPRLVKLGRELDTDAILKSYHFPKVGPVMSDVMSMAKAELDVQETIRNQLQGEKVYTGDRKLSNGRKVHFVTAKTLEAKNQDVIYSTWLKGEKFEDFQKTNPQAAVEVSEALVNHWVENAMFKSRFFHADLHQGNLKVRQEANGDVTVAILDFGMVGTLEKDERSILIRLGLATKQNTNATLIAKYLYALSEKHLNEISETELAERARHHLATNPPGSVTMDLWMAWGMSVGLKLPKKITAFGRGLGATEQLLVSAGSKKYIVGVMQEIALKHALELAPDLAAYVRDSTVAKFKERKATKRAKIDAPRESAAALAGANSKQTLRCEAVFTFN